MRQLGKSHAPRPHAVDVATAVTAAAHDATDVFASHAHRDAGSDLATL